MTSPVVASNSVPASENSVKDQTEEKCVNGQQNTRLCK